MMGDLGEEMGRDLNLGRNGEKVPKFRSNEERKRKDHQASARYKILFHPANLHMHMHMH